MSDAGEADVALPNLDGGTDLDDAGLAADIGLSDVRLSDDRLDVGPSDTGLRDAGPFDLGPSDTGPVDTGPVDTGPVDTGPGDAGPRCPPDMVYIPAGSFIMGDADTLSLGAQPPHMVTLSASCIDLTEVTVAAYRGCTAPGCTTPLTGGSCNWGVTGRDTHPINCVDWNQSRAYCQWRGGDLPTEAQWEYAARGPDAANHIYPWGNGAPAAQLCWSGVSSRSSTCPVQSFPSGNSPFGIFDMAGNVWEWTLDRFAVYSSAAAIDPTGPLSGTDRVVRGGTWFVTSASYVRAAVRDGDTPLDRSYYIGFRCARGAR